MENRLYFETTPENYAKELVEKYKEIETDIHDSYYGYLPLPYGGAVNAAVLLINEMIQMSGNRSESWEEFLYKTLKYLKTL